MHVSALGPLRLPPLLSSSKFSLMFRAMAQSMIPEGLVRFSHALVEDAALRSWFLGLQRLPTSLRAAAFTEMSRQMRSDSADEELATAALALARPDIYDAVLKAVRERCSL